MNTHIDINRQDHVQIIRLNRPEKKNAITRAMYQRITQALHEADSDETIRVTVLFGQAGVFCAGNDLQDFMEAPQSCVSLGKEVIELLHCLATQRKPLLAGVDGLAIGIGTTLNLHCDLTFATPRSTFHTPFVDLGLVPEAASSLLCPKIMGHQRAFALLALGKSLSAEQALQAGLIYRVTAEEQLEAEVIETAHSLAAKPPAALQLTRDLLRKAEEPISHRIDHEAKIFAERLTAPETAQALSAFLSRKA